MNEEDHLFACHNGKKKIDLVSKLGDTFNKSEKTH